MTHSVVVMFEADFRQSDDILNLLNIPTNNYLSQNYLIENIYE
ncbi:MAG: hypothetical protein HEQ35_30770 [Gloeotrichia echinulata IR180]|jgi:hypothetical protein